MMIWNIWIRVQMLDWSLHQIIHLAVVFVFVLCSSLSSIFMTYACECIWVFSNFASNDSKVLRSYGYVTLAWVMLKPILSNVKRSEQCETKKECGYLGATRFKSQLNIHVPQISVNFESISKIILNPCEYTIKMVNQSKMCANHQKKNRYKWLDISTKLIKPKLL